MSAVATGSLGGLDDEQRQGRQEADEDDQRRRRPGAEHAAGARGRDRGEGPGEGRDAARRRRRSCWRPGGAEAGLGHAAEGTTARPGARRACARRGPDGRPARRPDGGFPPSDVPLAACPATLSAAATLALRRLPALAVAVLLALAAWAAGGQAGRRSGCAGHHPHPGLVGAGGRAPTASSSASPTRQGAPLAAPDVTVHLRFYDDGADPEAVVFETDARFLWAIEDVRGLYAADVEFPRAGRWGTRFDATFPDGRQETVRADYDVWETTSTPAIGAPAPRVDSPTAADVGGDLSRISTDPEPVARFYERLHPGRHRRRRRRPSSPS